MGWVAVCTMQTNAALLYARFGKKQDMTSEGILYDSGAKERQIR